MRRLVVSAWSAPSRSMERDFRWSTCISLALVPRRPFGETRRPGGSGSSGRSTPPKAPLDHLRIYGWCRKGVVLRLVCALLLLGYRRHWEQPGGRESAGLHHKTVGRE